MAFRGSSEHSLDPNGRVIIPKKQRFLLGETFVITRGPEKCLRVFTLDFFNEISRAVQDLGTPLEALFDPEILRLRRHLFGEMVETGTHSQFRVVIPPKLREYAEITSNCLLVCTEDWIEIWNPDNWRAYSQRELTEGKLMGAGGGLLAKRPAAPVDGDAGVSQTGPTD
jgi:MraZ protein